MTAESLVQKTPDSQPSGGSWRGVGMMLLLGLGWILLWRVSALMEYAPHASIWFPPAGLTFAALLVLGSRALPVIALSCIVVSLWAGRIYAMEQTAWQLLPAAVLFTVAHIGAYGLGAWLLRRLVLDSREITVPAQIIAFLVTGSLCALLAALLGVEALVVGGMVAAEDSAGLWLPWWIGDMAATIALAPFFIGLLERLFPRPRHLFVLLSLPSPSHSLGPWMAKSAVLLSLLLAVMALTAVTDHDEWLAFGVFFLIIPQMWITHTEGALRVAATLAAFSTAIAVCVGLLGLTEHALVYQFAITVIAASTWFGLSVPVLVDQNRRLRRLADADELTGVTSRRHFFERAREELLAARRRGQPVSLAIFDIDHFKQINDRYGHSVGDAVLIGVVNAVARHLRREDLLGRFGGDEFMLLLNGCDAGSAVERCEQLRRALHDEASVDDPQLPVSATFSVIEVDPDESITKAFERADAALLAAKRAGRDRVVDGGGGHE